MTSKDHSFEDKETAYFLVSDGLSLIFYDECTNETLAVFLNCDITSCSL